MSAFDREWDQWERLFTSAFETGVYPPYNIIKENDSVWQIELAVAGFSREELDVDVKDSVLTVKGNKVANTRDYVHKGIATRAFTRQFRLGEYVEVEEAKYVDGILSIYLKKNVPEDKKPRGIKIK